MQSSHCYASTQGNLSQRMCAQWTLPAALLMGIGLSQSAECAEPQTFESYAILRIRQDPGVLFGPGELLSLAGQRALIKSPFVIIPALAAPGVADLPWIANQKAAKRADADRPVAGPGGILVQRAEPEVEWLCQQVIVHGVKNADGKLEILLIGMKGDDRRQLAVLVNAVAKAYVDRVAGEERMLLASKRELIKKNHETKVADVKRKRQLVEKIAMEVGTNDPKVAVARQEKLLESVMALRKEITAKRNVILLKEKSLEQLFKDNKVERDKQSAELAALKADLKTMSAEFDKQRKEIEDLGTSTEELDRRKEDLAMAETTERELSAALENLEAESRKPDRVTLIQEVPMPDAQQQEKKPAA